MECLECSSQKIETEIENLIIEYITNDLKIDKNPIKLDIVPWNHDASDNSGDDSGDNSGDEVHSQLIQLKKRTGNDSGFVTLASNGVQYWAMESLREYLGRVLRGVFISNNMSAGFYDELGDDDHVFMIDIQEDMSIPIISNKRVEEMEEKLMDEIVLTMGLNENEINVLRGEYCSPVLFFDKEENKIYVQF